MSLEKINNTSVEKNNLHKTEQNIQDQQSVPPFNAGNTYFSIFSKSMAKYKQSIDAVHLIYMIGIVAIIIILGLGIYSNHKFYESFEDIPYVFGETTQEQRDRINTMIEDDLDVAYSSLRKDIENCYSKYPKNSSACESCKADAVDKIVEKYGVK